ncbi:MAG: hypothetical protein J7L86_00275 [Candidatus Marinimicrobia bacterium]|nr:hypothetical protein [Candidatus Neomarinimicrobiota bacterium]
MKNLSQLSTRFFPDESGLPQNDSSGSFYKTIICYFTFFLNIHHSLDLSFIQIQFLKMANFILLW